jgi:hypothetical protein
LNELLRAVSSSFQGSFVHGSEVPAPGCGSKVPALILFMAVRCQLHDSKVSALYVLDLYSSNFLFNPTTPIPLHRRLQHASLLPPVATLAGHGLAPALLSRHISLRYCRVKLIVAFVQGSISDVGIEGKDSEVSALRS